MEYLNIVTLGLNQPAIVSSVIDMITKYECNIIRAHMTSLGPDFAASLIVGGNWNAIAKLEGMLPSLKDDLELTIISKRAHPVKNRISAIPYNIHVIGIDNSSLINEIVIFLLEQNITVDDLHLETVTPHTTETTVFILTIAINIPTDTSIAELREKFIELCDDLNVDGIIEPDKKF